MSLKDERHLPSRTAERDRHASRSLDPFGGFDDLVAGLRHRAGGILPTKLSTLRRDDPYRAPKIAVLPQTERSLNFLTAVFRVERRA